MASAVLPITKRTICYGSCDAGKTVHTSYSTLNTKLENVFTRLNLKKHLVNNKHLHTCGDIEGEFFIHRELSFSKVLTLLP